MNDKLSKTDIEKMEKEIEYRKLVLRKELIEAVKEARSHGDLSENFEYYAAKREKNINESRIRYLDRMVRTAQVIEDESGEDEVGLNKTVTILFEEDQDTSTFKLVTTIRNNSLHGLISIDSPLGKSLLGHRVGDRVQIKVNESVSYYVLVQEIKTPTGEEEEEIRKF